MIIIKLNVSRTRRRKEKSGVSCRTEHRQLTLCPLPADVKIADAKPLSFISNDRAQRVLYSAPVLDLIEAWAAASNILI